MAALDAKIDEFQKMMSKLQAKTQEVNASARAIDIQTRSELTMKFKSLQRELGDLSSQMRKTSQAMDEIIKEWAKSGGENL